MGKKKIFILIMCCILLGISTSCKTSQRASDGATIPYTVANGYFIKNNITQQPPIKITSKQEFDSYFGAAATMSEIPTDVDFTRQFVVAVSMPQTNTLTNLYPQSLKEKNGRLVFSYKVENGKKQSYSMVPLMLIVIDKKYDAEVVPEKTN